MSEPNPGLAGHDDELRTAIAAVRRHWRRRVLLEGALGVVIAALLAVLAGIGLHALLGSSHTTVAVVRIVGYVVVVAAIARFLLQPAFRRVSDDRLALYVEERAPELRQTFLSAVQQLDADASAGASPALARRVMARAVEEIHRLDDGATLERPRARMAVVRLVGAVAVATAAVAFGPAALRNMARLLFVPWSEAAAAAIPAMSVSPGNISVPRGAALDVRAELRGFSNGSAEVVMRPDSAGEWTRIAMVRDSTGSGYVTRLFDIARNTDYYIEADGIRSPTYRITVTDLPTVKQLGLELRYPAYTGLPPQKIDNGGDVVAVTGTTAIVTIDATLPVRGGSLRFDDGAVTPLTLTADGRLTGSFRVAHDGFYRVDLTGSDGGQVPGTVQHSIEALVDHPPTVRIEKPGRDTRVGSVEEVPIAIRATDDYGVRGVELHFAVNGGTGRTIVLTDSVHGANTDVRAAHTVFLEDFSLKPGDLVAYHAIARDGAGHTGSSDIYFLEVRAYGKNYRQADQNGGGGGGGGAQNPGSLTERQRQVVTGTFNWQRDSATTPDRERRENATTLAISQGKLRADAVTLAARIASRDVAQEDSGFVIVKAAIDTAVIAMAAAENGLGKHVMSEALPPEQRALQMLQRADEAYHDVQVQLNGGGGGGGGGQSNSQDLADLFELQTDKLKNQYEAVQSQSSAEQQQQQALDSTAERLKQIATRLQQQDQRAQQALDSLQRRLPQQQQQSSGGGGGGGGGQSSQSSQSGQSGRSGQSGAQSLSRGNTAPQKPSGGGATGSAQRAMAQQVEDEARRLERLSREQNKPDLAQTAQQLQQAADQMRQAAAGASEQGRQALSQLQAAAKSIDDARTSAATQGAQDLAHRAQQLGAEQEQIAKDVAALPNASGADKENRTRDLEARKDTLANQVQQLQSDAQKLASQVRQEQPAAANGIQNAAGEIRDKDLVRNIDWSRTMLRGENVSPEYQRTIENDISDNLNNVANQLAGAAGQGSQERQQQQAQNNALKQTRDLVRDLESLQQRTAPADSTGRGQTAPGAAQGQPAQGQQGQGQQRQASQGERGQGQQGQQGQGQQGQGEQGSQGQQGQGQQGQQRQQSQGQLGQQSQGRGQRQGQQQGQGQGEGQRGGGQQGSANGNRGGSGGGFAAPGSANGSGMTTDPRQFGREVGLRREEAESLRGNLAKQGLNVVPLDHVIDEMRQLERAGTTSPGKTDGLQSAIIAGLKSFEFDLWRHYNIGADNKPALGASGDVPPEFRSLVEEYYRSLARPAPTIKPPPQ